MWVYKGEINLKENVYTLVELNSILNQIRKDYDKLEEAQTIVEILDDPNKEEELEPTILKNVRSNEK